MPISPKIILFCLIASAAARMAQPAHAQEPVPLDNPSSLAVQALELGDPFFRLVIQRSPQPRRLADVEAAIQPDVSRRQAFVVHEGIKQSTPGGRRSVIAFVGKNTASGGAPIDVDGTVMLSVFFAPGRFPANDDGTESWGWDAGRGRYNYYKLNGQTWFFQGTSSGPEVSQRTGCMACHHNGTPIMKELMLPWANWNSISAPVSYLKNTTWNPPQAPIFPPGRLIGAERLEPSILQAMRRFHDHKIASARQSTAPGTDRIVGARELLRPLFETTEINLASSRVTTGNLHPFNSSTSGPLQVIEIPNTHFLNARVLATTDLPGSSAATTLNISEATGFSAVAKIPAEDYADTVRARDLLLFIPRPTPSPCAVPLTGLPGDANFAWLHLEPGLFDVTRIEKLLIGKLVSPDFVAAVLAIDLREPIYSEARAKLLDFVPDSYFVTSAGPTDLTDKVLAEIDAAGTSADAEARDFAARLRGGDAVGRLRQDVITYLAEIRDAFADTSSAAYRQALKEQFDVLLERRGFMRSRPELCAMVEGPLIPVLPN